MNYQTNMDAICDRNAEASCRLIKWDPNISKEDILMKMYIEKGVDF